MQRYQHHQIQLQLGFCAGWGAVGHGWWCYNQALHGEIFDFPRHKTQVRNISIFTEQSDELAFIVCVLHDRVTCWEIGPKDKILIRAMCTFCSSKTLLCFDWSLEVSVKHHNYQMGPTALRTFCRRSWSEPYFGQTIWYRASFPSTTLASILRGPSYHTANLWRRRALLPFRRSP